MARSVVAGATLASALLVPAAPGVADEVTNLADSGAGSLRSAIASTAAGGDVTFAPGLAGETILLSSELTIDKDLTIDGPSAKELTISGGDSTRVFRITGGADATIEDVTIRDGRAGGQEPVGAGVLSFDGDVITLRRVVLRDNEVRLSPTDGVVPFGGAVAVYSGRVVVSDSTVAGNVADAQGGGGGLFIASPATFAVSNTTITGNHAYGGGGILSGLSTGSIVSSTIAGNTADHVGGGIGTFAGGVTLERSLVTGNSATDGGPACDGPLATEGANVVDTIAGCGFATGGTDAVAPAPVAALGDHGGTTLTMPPLAGSPAIDHVAGACPGADQRGVVRPQGIGCDAGAVEMRQGLAASGPLTLGSAQIGQNTAPASATITNTGELAAAITAVTVTGPNAAEVGSVPDPDACAVAMVLAAGETCILKARLSPTTVGAKQATYTVAIAGSIVDVPVSGTGDPVPPPPASQGGGGSASTDPLPLPPAPSAVAVLVGTSTKARKGGRLKLRLRCTTVGAARCTGSLTLRLGARKLKKAYSIAAGKEALVRIRLGAADRRRLARRRSIRSAVTVITRQPDGSRRTTHQRSLKLLRA
jgi:hypothetical protein